MRTRTTRAWPVSGCRRSPQGARRGTTAQHGLALSARGRHRLLRPPGAQPRRNLVCWCGPAWCTVVGMGRITVDVNEEWLEAAAEVLGTHTKVATINAALHAFAVRRQAREIVAAF